MKTYSPFERYCAQCGRLIITRNSQQYVYKRRDFRRQNPTYGKTIYFCSDSCMQVFEKTNPRKQYARGFKEG